MLGVVFDVGDKLNEELSAYGSNIVIEPKSDAVVADLYETVDAATPNRPPSSRKAISRRSKRSSGHTTSPTSRRNSICHADITAGTGGDAATVPVVGTWFNTTLHLATGETSVVGVQGMRSWWTINGRWARDDADEAMIGADLADQLHIDAPGMTITLSRGNAAATVTVVGIYDSGRRGKRRRLCSLGDVAGTERPDRQCRRGGGQSTDHNRKTTWHAKCPATPRPSPRRNGKPGIAPPTPRRSPTRSRRCSPTPWPNRFARSPNCKAMYSTRLARS